MERVYNSNHDENTTIHTHVGFIIGGVRWRPDPSGCQQFANAGTIADRNGDCDSDHHRDDDPKRDTNRY